MIHRWVLIGIHQSIYGASIGHFKFYRGTIASDRDMGTSTWIECTTGKFVITNIDNNISDKTMESLENEPMTDLDLSLLLLLSL
jgi:hypothetical protein